MPPSTADDGKPPAELRVENYRCLLQSFTISDLEKLDDSLHTNRDPDELGESAELVNLPSGLSLSMKKILFIVNDKSKHKYQIHESI
jgi:hypothetical protein